MKREKAQKGGEEGRGERRGEGESTMGQVWNLHTLLVAHTIGIFASA